MNDYQNPLRDLVKASLMSNAYPNHDFLESAVKTLYVPYPPDKIFYVNSYIKLHELDQFVVNNERANELVININDSYAEYVVNWFEGKEKVFKRNFLTREDYQAAIIFINLFGIRQLEGIAIATNVEEKYLHTLSLSINRILDVQTMISNKKVKVVDATKLFIKTVYETTSLDSSHMARYLSTKENEFLKKAINLYENKYLRKENYV